MGNDASSAAVRRFYAVFRAGDNDAVRDCFTEDVVWHLPGRSPLAGDYVGPRVPVGIDATSSDLATDPPL